MELMVLSLHPWRIEGILREKGRGVDLGLERRGGAAFAAVIQQKRSVLSDPSIENYKLVPDKKEKCIEVSNGLRMK